MFSVFSSPKLGKTNKELLKTSLQKNKKRRNRLHKIDFVVAFCFIFIWWRCFLLFFTGICFINRDEGKDKKLKK
jgi:hypothetical protein